MVPFAVDPGRTVLVSVNIQNVFVTDSLRAVPQGVQVAGRLNRLAAARRRAGIPVIWTRHVVRPEDSNTSFYGTDLEVLLRSRGIDTIILGGINTNAFVDTTAREARCARVPGQWQRSRQGGEGCLPSSRNGMARPPAWAGISCLGCSSGHCPGQFPGTRRNRAIRPGARCAGWPRAGTMTR